MSTVSISPVMAVWLQAGRVSCVFEHGATIGRKPDDTEDGSVEGGCGGSEVMD
jgi:hypothetical protein